MEQQRHEENTSEEVRFRRAAEQELGFITETQTEPEAITTPPVSLEQCKPETQTEMDQQQGVPSILLILSIPVILASLTALAGLFPAFASRIVPIGTALILAAILYCNAHRRRADRRRRHIYQQREDKRHIGLLIEESVGNGEKSQIARRTLTRLLPTLTTSDASLLTKGQRRTLYRSLTEWSPPMREFHSALSLQNDYTLAALQALQQIGGEEAIPTVTELTRSSDDRIRNAANACLPSLQSNKENARNSQILLRAAMPAPLDNAPDTLLRASAPTESGTPPEQLLRASEAESE